MKTKTVIVDNVRITTTYGMQDIAPGKQPPYFSITADMSKGAHRSIGCLHDEIRKYFPELSELIQWHLCDITGLPMHYFANAEYWFEQKNWDYVKSTIVFGALPSDMCYNVPNMTMEEFHSFLERRLPMLKVAFTECMKRFGVL